LTRSTSSGFIRLGSAWDVPSSSLISKAMRSVMFLTESTTAPSHCLELLATHHWQHDRLAIGSGSTRPYSEARGCDEAGCRACPLHFSVRVGVLCLLRDSARGDALPVLADARPDIRTGDRPSRGTVHCYSAANARCMLDSGRW
jgi:hypothetical protein